MNPSSPSVVVWESGRLARPLRRAPVPGPRAWLYIALLAGAALLLAAYVSVLERAVERTQLARAQRHERTLALAQCEADRPPAEFGFCRAMVDGPAGPAASGEQEAQVAASAETPPANDVYQHSPAMAVLAMPSR
ncbi:MAG TPA: hypothetical protein VF457_12465 [Burkholderiaceae bacterium]